MNKELYIEDWEYIWERERMMIELENKQKQQMKFKSFPLVSKRKMPKFIKNNVHVRRKSNIHSGKIPTFIKTSFKSFISDRKDDGGRRRLLQ